MITLFKEILLEPTKVVLNSLPTTPTTVDAAAGDCVGLGRKTTALIQRKIAKLRFNNLLFIFTKTKSSIII